EPLTIDLDLVRAGEAAAGAEERDRRPRLDVSQLARAPIEHDTVLARDHFLHVDANVARVDAKGWRAAGMLRDAGAGQHRLRRRAAVIDAGAAQELLLDHCHALPEVGELVSEGTAPLSRADDDRVEVSHEYSALLF